MAQVVLVDPPLSQLQMAEMVLRVRLVSMVQVAAVA
jgi:hypothetical protein